MRGKTIKSILSWVLCFAMLSGMLPGALAHSEVNPETDAVEIAFFKLGPDAPAKPSADNAITDYQIEYSADTLKKGTTGAGHDNGAFYLETNTGALDDFVTISGIEVPEGVYKVDLIYKYNKTGRAIVQCALDEEPLADPIDLGSTTPTDGANVDGSTLLNGNQTIAGTLYSYPLTSDWESDGKGEHTFTATATKEGKIVLYGLLFTPPAALTLDKDEVTLDLLADDVTETVTATLGEGYETLSWESANDAIATVADGKDENTAVITAVGVGETTITATAENEAGDKKTRTVEVTVTKSTAITLNRSSLSFNIGESTDPASVTATYSDLFENLTWTSDKESVAKVEGTGATVNIVPVGEGTATITATVTRKAGGGPESAELEVTVERVSRIPISLSASASPNVRTLNAAQQYVRVAASTTVGELRNALVFPKTRADGFLVQDKSGATKNDGDVLLSSDVLVVEQNGENAHYSLIVEGDETSTAITVKNNPDDFEFGMQGSNIGEITDDSITLIDGKVRRIWVADTTIPVSGADGKNDKNLAKEINKPDYTGDVGRLRALRSCDEIVEQLASANGTEQTYQIVDAKGVEKTTALPVDGDKLVVTAADGSTTKEYAISVVQAAMNGRLDLSQTEMTADTEQTLVLEYYAGQRTPEATVDIELPAGMDAISESDITINVIGRGDVAFADFSESAGKLNADGTFENEKMHQVLGRLASDYDYQTLGTVTLSTAGGGGSNPALHRP